MKKLISSVLHALSSTVEALLGIASTRVLACDGSSRGAQTLKSKTIPSPHPHEGALPPGYEHMSLAAARLA